MQQPGDFAVGGRRLQVEIVAQQCVQRRFLVAGLDQRDALALQVPARDRVRDLPDPGFQRRVEAVLVQVTVHAQEGFLAQLARVLDRKSTRLNSSHVKISYAVVCLKKKTK